MATHKNTLVFIFILVWFSSFNIRQPDIEKTAFSISDTTRDRMRKTFTSEIGVIEKGGNNRGERIGQYLASTNLSQGHAWCAAFVKWAFQQNGIQTPGANAWSPSWFPTQKVIFKQRKGKNPQKSDVFGLYYTHLGRVGHVGFVDEFHGDYIITVEGNTNDGGSRDGDGVHRKRRLMRTIHIISDWIGNN